MCEITTVKEVVRRVGEIAGYAKDDETAHGAEDELYEGILKAIANGTAEDPKAMAKEALATQKIDFSRWFA